MSLLEDEKRAEERDRTIANERAKITATYLNGLAIALVAVGFFAPVFAPRPATLSTQEALQWQAFIGLLCLCISGILHLAARRMLRGMR